MNGRLEDIGSRLLRHAAHRNRVNGNDKSSRTPKRVALAVRISLKIDPQKICAPYIGGLSCVVAT